MDEARCAALIRRHLPFHLALADGQRIPATLAQRHFVAAARGGTPPGTGHGRALALWRQRAPRVTRTLDAEAARASLIPDARSRAAARLSLQPTSHPRKP